MSDTNHTPTILGYFLENHIDEVRYMMPFLGGQELMFALASSSCLAQVQLGQTAEEAGTVPAQRKSTYLGSTALTEHAVRSGLLEPSEELMGLAATATPLDGHPLQHTDMCPRPMHTSDPVPAAPACLPDSRALLRGS